MAAASNIEDTLQNSLISAALSLIEGRPHSTQALLNVVDSFPLTPATPEGSRLGSACSYGALAKFLDSSDAKIAEIVPRLFTQLLDPKLTSYSVQIAVIKVLPALVKQQCQVQRDTPHIPHIVMNEKLHELVDLALNDEHEVTRRGAALGVGACVKGMSISVLKSTDVMNRIESTVNTSKKGPAKQGAILCLEGLTRSLGRLFEPYVISTLPILLKAFADSAPLVRSATQITSKIIMSNLSAHGVKLVLPHLLTGIDNPLWRTKLASIELLTSMVAGNGKQLAVSLPKIVPILANVVNDTHVKVKHAAQFALQKVGAVITNPEIKELAPLLFPCLSASSETVTRKALDALLSTSFVHSVDAPSLALVCPIVLRALRERNASSKKKGAQIVGSMVLLIKEAKDIAPHLPVLMPALKASLIDPIPDVRATTAKALGTLALSLPEDYLGDLVPWLFTMLKSPESPVERSGAAHGLSETMLAFGPARINGFLPDLMSTADDPSTPPHVKEGYLGLFVFLPQSMGADQFEPWFDRVLACLLKALSEEYQSVRDIAYRAASSICRVFGASHTAYILPSLEDALFASEYRIRHHAVLLLVLVIEQVLRANRMNINNVDLISCEVMPPERRSFVLSSLYIVRSDENASVRQAATSAWKQLVHHTPRTVRELLPILMRRLIHLLASTSKEKQKCASLCVGELVAKLGDRVLPDLMPIFFKSLTSSESSEGTREGVCIGLTELINNCSRQLLTEYISELIPATRSAICDVSPNVRLAASHVVALLHQTVGQSATAPIITWLLAQLAEDNRRCLDGLEQLLVRQGSMVYPIILENLSVAGPPWKSAAQIHGLATLASLEEMNIFYRHVTDVLDPIVKTLAHPECENVKNDCLEAGKKLMVKVDVQGLNIILSTLMQYLDLGRRKCSKSGRMIPDSSIKDDKKTQYAREREASSMMLKVFFDVTVVPSQHYIQIVLPTLLPIALNDENESTMKEAFSAFSSLIKKSKKEEHGSYLEEVRNIILGEVTDPLTGEVIEGKILPGLALSCGLEPFYPVYQHSLMFGSPQLREVSARGLGELVNHTTQEALKPYVVKITGPLIRIVGDRFMSSVKLAIVDTLEALLLKGGTALRPFLPQLQTTYVKCLSDTSSEQVRTRAGESLGTLVKLNPRVDTLLSDLAAGIRGETAITVTETVGGVSEEEAKNDIRLSMITAMAEVLTEIPEDKFKDPMLSKVYEALVQGMRSAMTKEFGGVSTEARVYLKKCFSLCLERWPESFEDKKNDIERLLK